MSDIEFKLSERKPQPFRVFVTEKWMQHKDELLEWERRQPDYTSRDYFRKYRWQLRKMYRQERGSLWDLGKKNSKLNVR